MLLFSTGAYFGTVISMPLSGALAESSAGWPSIFYFFGEFATYHTESMLENNF